MTIRRQRAQLALKLESTAGTENAPDADDVFLVFNPDFTPEIGMNEQEIKRFSIFRAINAIHSGDFSKAGFEKECSEEAYKRAGKSQDQHNKFMIPYDVTSKRGFNADGKVDVRSNEWIAATTTKGGFTVATEVGPMVNILLDALFSRQAGVRVLTGLQGNLTLPRHASDTWASWWVVEATAASQLYPTLDQIALTPKEIAAYSDISTKLLMQSSENLEAYIQMHIARRLALGIDTAIIKGGSTGGSSAAPTKGLLNTTLGINTVDFGTTTLAAAPTWLKMVQLETEVGIDNAIMPDSRLAYVMNARGMEKMKTVNGYVLNNKFYFS
jgi:HK97 family phage major capsid protein